MAGATAAQLIGGLSAQMSPLVIDGLMKGLSLSERDAGFILTIELVTLALTAMAIAPVLPRVSARRASLFAVTLTLLAQGASIFSTSWASLVLLRSVGGVGEGALWAISLFIVASRSNNPDKDYGYFTVVWALGSIALFAIGAEVTAAFQHRGILALIALVDLALAPLLFLTPDTYLSRVDGAAPNRTVQSSLPGLMTLAAIGLFLTAGAAVYAFSTSLGERAGLDARAVAYTLTIASALGLVGAGTATALNVRWGRGLPISAFCIGFAFAVLTLCLWRDPTAYVVALVVSVIIYNFSTPYLFGLAAALDRSGRWAAAGGSVYLLGFAAGPLLAGTVIATAGYLGLATICVAITIIVWVLTMIVNRRLGTIGS
ncbi:MULTISPECIES: MFS transporter [unclassified Hyphomicrobium]|uniref:MFS transporter n=1 Tax=unclassified Hyphomicrobium TaxID=2619925 RepID=UPI00030DFCF3|nr:MULTISPECIES: MFS transporter [unclassified Hyphomicrobium]